MSRKLRLGIIGLGAAGRRLREIHHGRHDPQHGDRRDLRRRRRQTSEGRISTGVPFFSDYLELLDSGAVDAVVTDRSALPAPGGDDGRPLPRACTCWSINPPASTPSRCATPRSCGEQTRPHHRNHVQPTDEPAVPGSASELVAERRTRQASGTPAGSSPPGGDRRATTTKAQWRATWGGEGGGVLVNQAPHQLDLWQWICGVPSRSSRSSPSDSGAISRWRTR